MTNLVKYFRWYVNSHMLDLSDVGNLQCKNKIQFVIGGKWAVPDGTAIPGQPVTRPEQAPSHHPLTKMSLISKGAHGPRIRY